MDARQCMIIDLERRGDQRMFVTEQVVSINENKNGLWSVRFSTSPHLFNYNKSRLLYLIHPKAIDLGEKGLYINNKRISNVSEVLQFTDGTHTFYRVGYTNAGYENFQGNEVYITRTPIDKNGGSTWSYLRKLAEETGLMNSDEDSILSKQYDLVDVKRDNVPLAQYLGDKTKLRVYHKPKRIYYPFGCNASQKSAVEAALTNQVSVIQGPPGTGKTQTILNIVANLLMAGKNVLVVSSNNSAVENVAEKLNDVKLGFLVAKLGSVKNKEDFISNQSGYPEMKGRSLENASIVEEKVLDALRTISQGFDNQLRQAQLNAEYEALIKEAKHDNILQNGSSKISWLEGKSASKLMTLINLYRMIAENGQKPNLWFRLKYSFVFGIRMFSFLNRNFSDVITKLEATYYLLRKSEIEQELDTIASILKSIDIKSNINTLRSSSLQVLKAKVSKRYNGSTRRLFSVREIKPQTEEFLKEYPIVLSTTYSAKSCISKDMVFDYVIMDEASQIDIKTGALALSCAMNAVIVGDDKQLPNVVSREELHALNAIQSTYKVDDKYDAASHSFLQSCVKVFNDAPTVLLREHYRCHPKIIEFCNQRFYNGELIAMTSGYEAQKVLQVVRTPKGNHARGHFNQRELDVIVHEVLPKYTDSDSIGIITPYRLQADEINKAVGRDIASTVHKYQGRECDTIILSTVDNAPTNFSDDANLLNVAISRAKTHLCIVTSGNDIPEETNLAQLINYIQYNNFEVKESNIYSVFDLLYKQYTEERLAYLSSCSQVSDYLSENLAYNVLADAIAELGLANVEVLCHYPLSKLISCKGTLDERERAFVESQYSHVDFLIYNSLTKRPLQIIEIDGWHYHRENETQQSRDALKDQIVKKAGLSLYRISTTDTVNVKTMKSFLQKQLSID